MAESVPSQLSFSKFISHTFPGILIAIGLLLILGIISQFFNNAFLLNEDNNNWLSFIGAIGGLIFFGTTLGILIDYIHHIIIDTNLTKIVDTLFGITFLQKTFKSTFELNQKLQNEIKIIEKDHGKMPSFFYFISFIPTDKFTYLDENYFCYIECAFNFSISFFFLAIIYSIFFYELGYDMKVIFIIITFIILSLFCFYAGLHLSLRHKLNITHFIRGAIEFYHLKFAGSTVVL